MCRGVEREKRINEPVGAERPISFFGLSEPVALTKYPALPPVSPAAAWTLCTAWWSLSGGQSVAPGTQAGLGAKEPPSCAVDDTQKIWLNLLAIIEALCGRSGGGEPLPSG